MKNEQKTQNYFVMKGETVKNLILQKGYNVAQVAEMIGTSQQNLASNLKHGDIRTGLLEQISGALNIPLAAFYGEAFGMAQQITGNNNTQVSGNSNMVGAGADWLTVLLRKDEQLELAMRQTSRAQEQTSKAQEQMDRVLDKLMRM